jgi:hypothetical protein
MRKQYSPVLSFCLMVLVVAAMVCAMYTSSAEAGNLCMHVDLCFFFLLLKKDIACVRLISYFYMCFVKLFRPQNFVLSSYILKFERYHLC